MKRIWMSLLLLGMLGCFVACGAQTDGDKQQNAGGNGGSVIELPEDKFN